VSAPSPTAPAPTAPAPSRLSLACASDERLAELARDGDERAFEVIVERYGPQLLANARRIAGERAAEDALQHAFVCAWHALRGRRDVRHLRAWLFKIVHRSALQTLRERRDVPREFIDAPHPQAVSVEEEFERSMRARAVLAALASLPLREREALVGTSVEGRSTNDVARELGIADGALRQLVFRARTRARAAVGAFTPPALVLRLRAFAGSSGRRAQTLVSGASGSCPPITNPVAVGSAIVLAAAGAQVAGVPLIPRGHLSARGSSALRVQTGRDGLQRRSGTRATARTHGGSAPALPRANHATSTTSLPAATGSEPPLRSAAPVERGWPAGLPRSSAPAAGAQASAQSATSALLANPSTPSLPVAQTPTLRAGSVSEATAGAAGQVAGAAAEATRSAPRTAEHVVTTVVEPIASGVRGTVEAVAGHSR
jgi:RNA polymerase sigma-70 factor (ECF subfamily)